MRKGDCMAWKRLQQRIRFAQPTFWVAFLVHGRKGPRLRGQVQCVGLRALQENCSSGSSGGE